MTQKRLIITHLQHQHTGYEIPDYLDELPILWNTTLIDSSITNSLEFCNTLTSVSDINISTLDANTNVNGIHCDSYDQCMDLSLTTAPVCCSTRYACDGANISISKTFNSSIAVRCDGGGSCNLASNFVGLHSDNLHSTGHVIMSGGRAITGSITATTATLQANLEYDIFCGGLGHVEVNIYVMQIICIVLV